MLHIKKVSNILIWNKQGKHQIEDMRVTYLASPPLVTSSHHTDNRGEVQNGAGVPELFAATRGVHVVIGDTGHHHLTLQQTPSDLIKQPVLW